MAYVKKYATKEERSAALAAGARKANEVLRMNGNRKGGRKPALKCDKDPTTSCTIRESDARYIDRMAFSLGIAKAACIRVLVLQYRVLHPEIVVGEEATAKLNASLGELGRFVKA